mgnify:CR=1 FL=1
MNIKITFVGIAVILLGAGCVSKSTSTSQTPAAQATEQAITTPTPSIQRQPTDFGTPPEQPQDEQPASKPGSYLDYSADALAKANANGGKAVLFFYADWCPFCVEADKQFKAKLDQIPKGVTVLKADYDKETTLKKKYVVTYQHTFVQVDGDGKLVSKWNGGDIESLKKYLK